MALTFKKIGETVYKMDSTYDANFGDWIRNEENSRIIGHHLSQYVDEYSVDDIILVLKWIVKDWTLRSIILLSRKMIIEDLMINKDKKKILKRIDIIKGLVETWNSIFISEFIISVIKTFTNEEKTEFIKVLLSTFEINKRKDILYQIKPKVDSDIKLDINEKITVKCSSSENNI
ncbi:hypothetical protein SLOPH_1708 [Spraguea lophii 42_110]|uniref:Uncharacterized protein n=1 Tax=Spraguea lophii (strain 42_110) TaxID=1358809 RepID=S7XIP1_SPRLO|nr:hypothetical protein SLOPH_1708 [Spraguea lophii 42_110]